MHRIAASIVVITAVGGAAGPYAAGPVHLAALSVGDKMPFPLVDLQVDWDDIDKVGAPRRPGRDCAPQMTYYLNRAVYA